MKTPCKYCTDPNCSGGYYGGDEQLWRACEHRDTRPLMDKLEEMLGQLERNELTDAFTIRMRLQSFLDYERSDKTVRIGPGGIPESD